MATILVVDDHAINREFLVTLLGYGGHGLLQASDGAEALALARVERPDLVISDILMPTMDGYEFVRQLRADKTIAQTPVIFYTAHYLEPEAQGLAQACGVPFIITKPSEPEVILRTIDAALGRREAPPHPPTQEFDREHLRVLTDKLSEKAEQLRRVNERLTALIELGQELACERDPVRGLEGLCRAAREIVGARFAAVGVPDDTGQQLRYFLTSGIGSESVARLGPPLGGQTVLATLSMERRAVRLASSDEVARVGLPANFPAASSLLAVSIVSLKKHYGWLCLSGKLGGGEFSEEDERLASILAGQVGRIYENGSLYAELQREAADLAQEVTERQRAEDEVRRLNAELERRVTERTAQLEATNRELEAFSYSVSHDLRAPLRTIDGFSAAVLEEHAEQLDAEGKQHLGRVRAAAVHMRQLIDDLLSLSRVSRAELTRQRVDLSALAAAVGAELQSADPQRLVTLIVAPGIVVDADARLLRIALENLLGNAWKYTRRQPQPVIELGVRQQQSKAVYVVRDNGAGFDMRFADKLFGAFQRLHGAHEFEGTGIGLATVQRIVHRHGGRIWVDAAVGQGATFFFTLAPPGSAP